MDNKKESTKTIKGLIAITLILFISSIGFFISFSYRNNPEKPKVSALIKNDGDLVINYVDGQDIIINKKGEFVYNISLKNTSLEKLFYSVSLEDISNDNIEIKVLNEDNQVIKNVKSKKENMDLLYLLTLEPSKTIRYKIVLTTLNIDSFSAKINVVNDLSNNQTFADLILLNSNVTQPLSKVGEEISKTNEELISSEDDDGISYYYRGNITNNYVKINDFLFRIVRINGDGTVRIVLNDVLQNENVFNKNYNEQAEYDSQLDINNTSLNNTLLNWLNKNFQDYLEFFADGSYCTDDIFDIEINDIKYTKAYQRVIKDKTPTLKCLGYKYQAKIGFLSIDEVSMAGANYKEENKDYYLYNDKIIGNYFTTNAYFINNSNYITMMDIKPDGSIGEGTLINKSAYLRPVVNINNNARVKGNGTIDNPYIIVN